MHPTAILAAAFLQVASLAGPGTLPRAAAMDVQAVRASSPVVIDGDLTEPFWATALVVDSFTQREPDEGLPATYRTAVRIAYDDAAIYVGAELFDPAPDSIVRALARRDRAIRADRFTVFLDPYRDRRTGFYFGVNAAGVLYDGTLYNDDWDDDTWDGVWDAAVRVTERGWTAELRIPYSQLRFHRRDRYRWGINFKREVARANEEAYLVFTPRNGSGFVSRFVELGGIEGVTPPARLEVMPYVTAKAEFLDHEPGDPFNDGSRYRPGVGLDLKYGLGGNLTLDATVNPDFGQVEVDPAVVNLSDVETFFEEKRPFFIEGASIFDFGSGGANRFWGFNNPSPDFLYTRRIGRAPQTSPRVPEGGHADVPTGTHIVGAAKLSGKLGEWSVGTLGAVTKREYAEVDSAGVRWRDELEPLTYYGVARAIKELGGGRQGLGFMATATLRSLGETDLRSELASSAFAVGLDGWTFLDHDRTWVLTGWGGMSHVRGSPERIEALQRNAIHYFQRPDAAHVEVDPAAASLSGWAGRVTLNKQKGRFYANTALAAVSPGFEVNDLGFQWTSDVVNVHQVVGYRWRTPTPWYRQINWDAATAHSWDFGGNHVHHAYWSRVNAQLRNYWWINLGGAVFPHRLNNRRTRGGPLMATPAGGEIFGGVETDDRKPVFVGVDGYVGRAGLGANRSWGVSTYVEWKPMSQLSLRLSPELDRTITAAQYVGELEDPRFTATFGRQYVFADLDQTTLSAAVRLNWIFTPKLSLELYAQPLVSAVDYGRLKALARPRSYEFVPTDGAGPDPDGAGPEAPASVTARDFTFASLRGNAVLRWEYLPGSTLCLVWTQNRADSEEAGEFRLGRSMGRLVDAEADNILAVKVSYWWNP
ncbi:MAG TPA: DUF5916 domain-containing protein [Gemmatimonadales bacterium]|nr:DUF5916 domain-containing protein [Gemmatimonadales bacterium]